MPSKLRALAVALVAASALALPAAANAGPAHEGSGSARASRAKHDAAQSKSRTRSGIELTAPDDGGTVAGTVTLRVTTSTAIAPTKVAFTVDGASYRSLAKKPWSTSLASTALGNGKHTLAVAAYVRGKLVATDNIVVDVENGGSVSPSQTAQGGAAGKSGGKGSKPTTPTAPTTPTTPPVTAPTTPEAPVNIPASDAKLYWGAWIGSQFTGSEAPWDVSAVTKFEQLAGKSLSLVNFSSPFAQCGQTCSFYGFPSGPMENIRQHGAIPFFSWASAAMGGANASEFQFSDLLEGKYDAYIRSWATAAKAWGHPFFLRFNWEMNGGWFQWSEGVNGNQPGQYVAAWRHVHDIFTQVGATNATWTWCPNVDPDHQMQNLSGLYPGDEYVDWTCLDGYNSGLNPQRPDKWRTFGQLFGSTYNEITQQIAPSKPMMIGEVGSSEYGGSKATWISEMLSQLPGLFPKIRGFMWFDKNEDADWPIETSQSSVSAFAKGISAANYTGNSFASLSASAVPPPS
jgi:hypothetical protein